MLNYNVHGPRNTDVLSKGSTLVKINSRALNKKKIRIIKEDASIHGIGAKVFVSLSGIE